MSGEKHGEIQVNVQLDHNNNLGYVFGSFISTGLGPDCPKV